MVIIAGSRGMSGAACLAGLGALRGGAGLVRVLTPESVQPIVAAGEPCLMTVPLSETKSGQISRKALGCLPEMAFDWADVVAIGPGLGSATGPDVGVSELVELTLRMLKIPVVIDADALNAAPDLLQTWLTARKNTPTILTPHPGEMARLRQGAGLRKLAVSDDDTRLRITHEYAHLTGAVVVLKGHRTVVCTPAEAYLNTTGNPGMATGGMGDVLTGLIAALLGQDLSGFDAARLGVYCHGAAADLVAQQIGPVGYLAREVADALPTALSAASRPRMGYTQPG